MTTSNSFFKLAGMLAMISCPLALISLGCIFTAFNWDFETAFNPAKAIAYQPDPSALLRWGWILDIFGYYLPVLPALLALYHWQKEKAPLHSQLFAISGLTYILIGAAGAAMLAGGTVPLYEAFQSGDAAQKSTVSQVFSNLNNEVMSGIWNIFTMTLAAVWFLGTGWLLRPEHRWLGWFTTLLGIASVLDVVGYILHSEALSGLGLNTYLFLAPIWAGRLGWVLFKQSKKIQKQ
jgi:hypothetical protein